MAAAGTMPQANLIYNGGQSWAQANGYPNLKYFFRPE